MAARVRTYESSRQISRLFTKSSLAGNTGTCDRHWSTQAGAKRCFAYRIPSETASSCTSAPITNRAWRTPTDIVRKTRAECTTGRKTVRLAPDLFARAKNDPSHQRPRRPAPGHNLGADLL